jgi:ubiquinone/menaquinone biosynthesis C-methylase UbiE
MVSLAAGTVLEIGVGSGANFPHYDRTTVKHLYALEPNPGMLRLALMQRHRASIEIEFLTQPGERIPLEDESVDTVVSTFTLCTIPVLDEALTGMARVLKRTGQLISSRTVWRLIPRCNDGSALVDIHNDTETPEQLHSHGQTLPVNVDGSAVEGTPYIPASYIVCDGPG